jgi:hypothetical protein
VWRLEVAALTFSFFSTLRPSFHSRRITACVAGMPLKGALETSCRNPIREYSTGWSKRLATLTNTTWQEGVESTRLEVIAGARKSWSGTAVSPLKEHEHRAVVEILRDGNCMRARTRKLPRDCAPCDRDRRQPARFNRGWFKRSDSVTVCDSALGEPR